MPEDIISHHLVSILRSEEELSILTLSSPKMIQLPLQMSSFHILDWNKVFGKLQTNVECTENFCLSLVFYFHLD